MIDIVVPVHKKESKNLIKNVRLISFFPIFTKFLRDQFLTRCFTKINYSYSQSGFIPGDSCVSQLPSLTHEIYKSVNCHPPTDVRGTFIDISKVFAKVWQESLTFKLKI